MNKINNSKEMDIVQKIVFAFKAIDKSLSALKFNFKTFLGLIAFPLFLSISLYVFYYAFIIRALDTSTETINISPIVWLGSFMLFLLMVISYIVIVPALLITQIASINKAKISAIVALKQSKRFLIRYVLIGLLIGLACFLPVIFMVPLFVILPPIALLIMPIFATWIIFVLLFTFLTPYLLITKNLSVIETIKASYYISKNNLQWVLAIFIVTYFLPFIITSFLTPFSSNFYITLINDIVYWSYFVAYSCLPAYIFVKHMNTDIDNYKNINNLKKSKSVSDAPKAIKYT